MAIIAVSYATQKCTSCAGTKLEYDKELKAWRCLYCGTLIERHEQVDTLFTIKNVVRQVLVDVSYVRLEGARDNLVECEKIDSRYIGTVIASLAYEMNMIIHGDISQAERRNMFAQLKKNYALLCADGDTPTEVEIALYEFLDSSEAIGTLILVYDSLNATARRDFLLHYFDPSEIYSLSLNTDLLNYSLKNEQYDIFDKIVHNVDNIQPLSALQTILKQYPDGQNKQNNALHILKNGSFGEDAKALFTEYISDSADSIDTKYAITAAICDQPYRPNIQCLMTHIFARIEDVQKIQALLDGMMKKALLDVEIYTILDYALSECEDSVCLCILQRFLDTNQFVELEHKHFAALLGRSSPVETKQKMIDIGLHFNVTEITKERFIATYLCDIRDSADNREKMLPYLFSLIKSLSTDTVEKYLLRNGIDGEAKVTVTKSIFAMDINRSFFRDTLNDYILRSEDAAGIKKAIITVLIDSQLKVSTRACLHLLQSTFSIDDKVDILRRFKESGFRYDGLVDEYINTTSPSQFSPAIFAELMTDIHTISEKAFVRYVLQIVSPGGDKAGYTAKLAQLSYCRVPHISCTVSHGGNTVGCNLLQGYVLAAPDSEDVALAVVQALSDGRPDVNTDVAVNGSSMKFKKYIASQKRTLSPLTAKLCSACRI